MSQSGSPDCTSDETEKCGMSEFLTPEQKDGSVSCTSPNCEKSGIDNDEVTSFGSGPVECFSAFLMLPLLVSKFFFAAIRIMQCE